MPDSLIVMWDRRRVSAVQAVTGTGPARLVGGWTSLWPEGLAPGQNATATGKWLQEEWQRAGLIATSVVAVMSREDVIVRHLELPAVPDEELADLVKFQAAARSAQPLTEMALDFLPLPSVAARPGRDVLAVTVSNGQVDTLRNTLTAAGRELAAITFSGAALAAWTAAMNTRRGISGGGTLGLGLTEDRGELAILDDAHPAYLHATRLPADDGDVLPGVVASEVARTLIAAGRLRPDLALSRVWLLGGPEALQTTLVDRLGCPVEAVDATEGLTDWSVPPVLRERSFERAVLYGAALQLEARHPAHVNFIKPRQPPPIRDPRKLQWAITAAAALGGLFFVSALWLVWLNSLDGNLVALRNEQKKLEAAIKAGQPDLEAFNLVSDWDLRNINQLEQLADLEALMPGDYERPYLSEFQYLVQQRDSLGRVRALGAAKTEQHISEFKARMADRPEFALDPAPVTQSRDEQYPKQMLIQSARVVPKVKPVAPADTDGAKPDSKKPTS